MVYTPMHSHPRIRAVVAPPFSSAPALVRCPRCDARDRFFLHLPEAAFRVLEDEADTELLLEVLDERGIVELLCDRCNEAFLQTPTDVAPS